MSKRKFVREIKAKEVKNLNPSDIIYLAMKDGSIILIVDDDENTIEYDDIKLDISYKRNQKNYKTIMSDSSLYTLENEKNYPTNASSNNIIDTKSNNSTLYSKIKQIKDNNIKINQKSKEDGRMNKTINNSSLHGIKNEKLDKSFDDLISRKNIGYHEIGYFNKDKSFKSNRMIITTNERSKSSVNYIINNDSKKEIRNYKAITPDKNNKNLNHLISISDLNYDVQNNMTPIRTRYNQKNNINKNNLNYYNFETINSNGGRNQNRSNISIDANPHPENNYSVKRKEIEIMGKIVNDSNSYKNIDHHHPNTLFDPKCYYCQNLARENRLNISNIKVESIYDNYSFLATFGNNEKKEDNIQYEYDENGYYYS